MTQLDLKFKIKNINSFKDGSQREVENRPIFKDYFGYSYHGSMDIKKGKKRTKCSSSIVVINTKQIPGQSSLPIRRKALLKLLILNDILLSLKLQYPDLFFYPKSTVELFKEVINEKEISRINNLLDLSHFPNTFYSGGDDDEEDSDSNSSEEITDYGLENLGFLIFEFLAFYTIVEDFNDFKNEHCIQYDEIQEKFQSIVKNIRGKKLSKFQKSVLFFNKEKPQTLVDILNAEDPNSIIESVISSKNGMSQRQSRRQSQRSNHDNLIEDIEDETSVFEDNNSEDLKSKFKRQQRRNTNFGIDRNLRDEETSSMRGDFGNYTQQPRGFKKSDIPSYGKGKQTQEDQEKGISTKLKCDATVATAMVASMALELGIGI